MDEAVFSASVLGIPSWLLMSTWKWSLPLKSRLSEWRSAKATPASPVSFLFHRGPLMDLFIMVAQSDSAAIACWSEYVRLKARVNMCE